MPVAASITGQTRLSIVCRPDPGSGKTTPSQSYSRSNSTGPRAENCFQCYSLVTCQQKAREDAVDKFAVSNPLVDSKSNTRQWQVINTTTWRASDNLTIKNLFSYGEFRGVHQSLTCSAIISRWSPRAPK